MGRQQGRRAVKSGESFEDYIANEAGLICQRRQAFIIRVGDRVQITKRHKRSGKVSGFKEPAPFTDFVALNLEDGKFIGFEAKKTSMKTSFAFSLLEKATEPVMGYNQRELLQMTAQAGGYAFVYVRRIIERIRVKYYVFPVDEEGAICGINDDERRSVPWDRAEPYKLRPTQTWYDKYFELKSEGLA